MRNGPCRYAVLRLSSEMVIALPHVTHNYKSQSLAPPGCQRPALAVRSAAGDIRTEPVEHRHGSTAVRSGSCSVATHLVSLSWCLSRVRSAGGLTVLNPGVRSLPLVFGDTPSPSPKQTGPTGLALDGSRRPLPCWAIAAAHQLDQHGALTFPAASRSSGAHPPPRHQTYRGCYLLSV